MNSKQFCIWLKGCLDITGSDSTKDQVNIIRKQLELLFDHMEDSPSPVISKSIVESPVSPIYIDPNVRFNC